MKHILSPLVFLFLVLQGFSQDLKEIPLTNQIKEVTLFLSGAQVFETATGTLPAGESVLLLKGLSPFLDEKSIQVKGQGNFTIQAVNKRLDFLSEKERSEAAKALDTQISALQKNQAFLRNRIQVLAAKSSLLAANKTLGGTQSGPSLTALKAALDFFDAEQSKILEEELRINAQLEEGERSLEALRQQLYALQQSTHRSTAEIRIRVKAPTSSQGTFQVNYLVANAGWYPKYDLRVKSITEPLQLQYKAEVYQNTGADWKNVKLRLSNANPNQSGQAPNLEPWQLNFARLAGPRNFNLPQLPGSISGQVLDHRNAPLAGVSVLVKGSTLGTVTDQEGKYSLVLPKNESTLIFSFVGKQIEERQVSNESILNVTLIDEGTIVMNEVADAVFYKKSLDQLPFAAENAQEELLTQLVFNPTTVEIEVADPYSIKSNGEKTLVDLKTYQIPATYRYTSIPKLDKEAFLVAEVTDWNQYNLLEGESNLYFEEGFVGRSILDASSLKDTLELSMGRDKSLVIQREKVAEYSKKRNLGASVTESRGYEITVKNNKNLPITLVVKDQIPVSVNSAITVTEESLSGGTLDPQTGIVIWELLLPAGGQQKLSLRYEVKYPKAERVILD